MWLSKALYNAVAKARQETFELNGWILVTPELAKMLLKYNVSNYRILNTAAAKKYAEDMKAGLWKKNGEPIIFSTDSIERNGQHRLQGVIDSGVPVLMYIIFDADPCDLYDLQRKRTCVQVLRAMGYSVSNITTSVARTIMAGKFVGNSKIGDAEVCQYIIKHYDMFKKMEKIIKTRVGKEKMVGNIASCALIAYSMLRTGEVSENILFDFFKVMNSNKKCGLHRDVTSALALRAQIDGYEGHGDNLNDRMAEYTYLAVKDFASKIGVVKKFVYPDGGKNAERLIREVQCMDGMCAKAA